MIIFRKRLVFWLLKAYLRKWGRIILFSFVGGLIAFFFFIFFSSKVAHLFPQKEKVGIVGAYTVDQLPHIITSQLSRGLTQVTPTGEVKPDLAESWEIQSSGKKYIFHLKKGVRFSNGKEVTSDLLGYTFKDVNVTTPDKYTIVFELKDQYSPFLVTVSRPVFPKGYQGLGTYAISDIKVNGNFISTLTVTQVNDKRSQIIYLFYPNQDALKTSYLLGETTKIIGINSPLLDSQNLTTYKNTHVERTVNYDQLVTLFYNTKDQVVSDNKLRKGLSYALPSSFSDGERAYLPYAPSSIFYNSDVTKERDPAHAKLLIDASLTSSSSSAVPTLTLTTLSKYKSTATKIANAWKEVGIQTKIAEVESKPAVFQMYLGDFMVPKDPDQYVLWHSKSESNITRFDSKRIDKLLEDGRRTINLEERKKIYTEFQKYLMDDAVNDTPASFLYFPYSYTITRQ